VVRTSRRTALTHAPSTLVRAPRFVERSLTVGALIATVGTVLVAIGVVVGEVLGTVVASLGAILITVAVLTVVYDAFLKDVLLGEIYTAIGVQKNIQALDLRMVVEKNQLDLTQALAGATEITAIPLDPETWSQSDWRHLLDSAAAKAIRIAVYLPNHDSPHIDGLAARLGKDRDELAAHIADLPDELAQSWDEKGLAIRGSRLNVYLYGTVPLVGLLVTDQTITLEVPPALSHTPTDRRTVALVFGRQGWLPLITSFVDEQLAEARIPGFSESVMRPLKPRVAPEPDEPDRPQAKVEQSEPQEEPSQ
jgi:hypothetical protein